MKLKIYTLIVVLVGIPAMMYLISTGMIAMDYWLNLSGTTVIHKILNNEAGEKFIAISSMFCVLFVVLIIPIILILNSNALSIEELDKEKIAYREATQKMKEVRQKYLDIIEKTNK